jgi:hypothetical protein
VVDLLKQQYRLTYRSTVPADGAMHHLRVDLKTGVQDAFDATEWGPVPEAAIATAVPTATPVPPTPVPTLAPSPTPTPQSPVGGLSTTTIAGLGLALLVAAGGALAIARRKPAEQALVCPNCGRDAGPDGLCPDCRVPGVTKPQVR